MTEVDYGVVIPTVGRPSLGRLLAALADAGGPPPREVVVVDDRRDPHQPLRLDARGLPVRVERSGGRGPAAARNRGWRATSTPWIAFVDDDVVPGPTWASDVVADLADQPWLVAASQGRLDVPLPTHRRPTDWERNTAGLMSARWITADMAYRRDVLVEVGGFDERFPRAYREDSDLGLRVADAGYLIVQGRRCSEHPVRAAGPWASVRAQAGNADDVLMRARHGPGWRTAAGAGTGRNLRHLITTVAAAGSLAAARAGRQRTAAWAGATWLVATTDFATARIRPGPRSPSEIATMLVTSVAIPPAAVGRSVAGWARLPGRMSDRARAPLGRTRSPLALRPPPYRAPVARRPRPAQVDVSWSPAAVLFDRDGTLIDDRPDNRDPERVTLMPGARVALRRARAEGLSVGVVTNQNAVGRGGLTLADVDAINRRVDELLGPFDTWQVCPHPPDAGCACRKPAPGLIKAAAVALDVDPSRCAVIGDIGADVDAARGAGARSVLVPTRATRPAEIAAAPVVAADVAGAVDLVLARMC